MPVSGAVVVTVAPELLFATLAEVLDHGPRLHVRPCQRHPGAPVGFAALPSRDQANANRRRTATPFAHRGLGSASKLEILLSGRDIGTIAVDESNLIWKTAVQVAESERREMPAIAMDVRNNIQLL